MSYEDIRTALLVLTFVVVVTMVLRSAAVRQSKELRKPAGYEATKIPDDILSHYNREPGNGLPYHHVVPYINALRARIEELEGKQ